MVNTFFGSSSTPWPLICNSWFPALKSLNTWRQHRNQLIDFYRFIPKFHVHNLSYYLWNGFGVWSRIFLLHLNGGQNPPSFVAHQTLLLRPQWMSTTRLFAVTHISASLFNWSLKLPALSALQGQHETLKCCREQSTTAEDEKHVNSLCCVL